MKTLQITLQIEGKTYKASCPGEKGKYDLPKEFPFDINEYVGPDYGYSLSLIALDEKGFVYFGYDQVKLVDGQADLTIKRRNGMVIDAHFELEGE